MCLVGCNKEPSDITVSVRVGISVSFRELYIFLSELCVLVSLNRVFSVCYLFSWCVCGWGGVFLLLV